MTTANPAVLVVSATTHEAAHVPPHLPLLVTGIGKVAAASAVAAALVTFNPDRVPVVVNIGTAGALRPGMSGLHLPGTVWNHDLDSDALARLGLLADDVLQLDGGDASVLATGDTFVTEAAVVERLAARASLVDMEGFAVAWASARAGARCRLVKHVSDNADESAWDWLTAVEVSALALGQWLSESYP